MSDPRLHPQWAHRVPTSLEHCDLGPDVEHAGLIVDEVLAEHHAAAGNLPEGR